MKTWISLTLLGIVMAVGACDKKDASGSGSPEKVEDAQTAGDTEGEAAGKDAGADEASANDVPTQEDFEEAAAKDVNKDNLEKTVKELEDEIGED